MENVIDILFIDDDCFFYLGNAYLDGDLEFNIDDDHGRPMDLNNISKIWIIKNDDISLISQDDLHNLLCPLCDQNGREVHVGDYIASIQDYDKADFAGLSVSSLVVYRVRSIYESAVSVKVVHDPHCSILSIMRDNISLSWAVIPCKKN